MRRAIAIGVIVAACTAHGQLLRYASQLDPNEPFRYTLDVDVFKLRNGLTVVLAPQADTDLVTVDMRYEAGSADDPAGKTGLAHFVEHLTFQARDAAGAPTLEQRLEASALGFHAFTSEDATHYSAAALVERWPELLRVEASRLQARCDAIDPALFERERAVVAQELLQRRGDALDPVRAEIFGAAHPYGRSVGGTDLASLTTKDVCDFLDAHYAPDRAILVVGGSFDRVKARAAIVGAFGRANRHGAPPPQVPPRAVPPDEVGQPPAMVEIDAPVDRPALLFAYARPRFGTQDALYHQIAIYLAGSALQRFELDRSDVLGVDVYDVGGKAGGDTVFSLELADGADAAKVAHEAKAALVQIETDRPRWAVTELRTYVYAALIGRYDDLDARGAMIADYMQYTGDASLHAVDLDRARRLDVPTVLGYLQDHVIEAQPVIVHVVPTKAAAVASIAAIRSTESPDLSSLDLPVDRTEADRPLAAPPPHPRDSELRLDNGLRVILAPRPASAIFTATIRFPVGAADDPAGAIGAARLTAQALQTDLTGGGTTSADRERLLASVNAGTSWRWNVAAHSTWFTTMGAASFADWHLWKLDSKLESGTYDRKLLLDVERDQVVTPIDHRAIVMLRHLFGPDDPIARDLEGSHVGTDALDAFREAHYRVNGATLIVAGAFDRAKIEGELRELWGAWPSTPAPPRAPATLPALHGPLVLAEDDTTDPQVHVWIAFRAGSTWSERAAVRRVAIAMLDQRLNAIREELGLSYGVRARYRDDLAAGVVEIIGDVNARGAGEAIARIVKELHTMHDQGASLRAEFVRGRRSALRDALAQGASAEDIEDERAIAAQDAPITLLAALPAQIAAVRPVDVGALLAEDLDPASMVVYVSGPGAHAAAEAAGLAPITTVGK